MAKKNREMSTLGFVMSKLGIKSKDMKVLLGVSRKVINIYRCSADEQLPKAFKEPNRLRKYIESAKKGTDTYKEAKELFKEYIHDNSLHGFNSTKIEEAGVQRVICKCRNRGSKRPF